MEIGINELSIAHQKDKIMKIFDNSVECLQYADKMKKKHNIDISCDPLYVILMQAESKGERKILK